MPLGTNLDSRGRRLRGDCCRDLLYHDRRDLTSRPLRVAAPGWRTSSPAASWCSRCGGSRRTGWRRGGRWSSAGRGGPLAAADQRGVAGSLIVAALGSAGAGALLYAPAVTFLTELDAFYLHSK